MIRFFIAFVALSLFCQRSDGQDWPALRGENGYGAITTENGILRRTSSVQLKTKWKRQLGSGYSSIVVSGDSLVTMYTDGTDDLVVCLDAADGETRWETKTNPMFKGENGSFDGPLSTPVILNQRVFVLSALGRLICLNLKNGEEIWSRDLPKDTGVKRPHYGFVTSPIVVAVSNEQRSGRGGGLQVGTSAMLIVQVGAVKKQVFGIDPKSGKTVWTAGDDIVNSQSPALIEFDGNLLVLVAGAKKLTGVDPADGNVRFEFEHKGTNGQSVMPVPLGDDRILLTLDDRFSKAVVLKPVSNVESEIEVSDVWQERTIKNTYNMPVLYGDGVFAYSTRILTCVDPATGKALWKTRSPGDGFLIAVDGHLVIGTKSGSVHLAIASTEGYKEISSVSLFKDLVWSVPAYSDNSIFVRSLGEIARVDLVASGEENATAESSEVPLGPTFNTMLGEVKRCESDDAKLQVIEQWIQKQEQFPVIDGEIAHFIYQGNNADVALAGDFFGARQERKMIPVAGTNFFYYTVKLHPQQRVNYCFLIDFQPIADPRNQRQAKSTLYAGEMEFALRLKGKEPLDMSWFGMPQWKQPQYLKPIDGVEGESLAVGRLVERTINVPDNADGETLKIYLPPSYDALADRRFPVAYVLDGANAMEAGEMVNACNRLFQIDDNLSAIVVFLKGYGPKFHETLENEIIPLVDNDFKTVSDRQGRLILGCGFTGGESIVIAAVKNTLFGNVSSQSPLVFAAEEKMISETMSKVVLPTKVHVQWGRWDIFNPHENWDVRTEAVRIVSKLRKNKHLSVSGAMVNDSTDWSSWKNRYVEIFGLLKRSR